MRVKDLVICLSLASLANAACTEQEVFIESEAQFVQEYADRIERVADGVYLFTAGELAGKVIAIGDSGLEYDLTVHRLRLKERADQGHPAGASAKIVEDLEKLQREFRRASKDGAGEITTMASDSAMIRCSYWDPNWSWPVEFYGQAWVSASAELYQSNGGGGYNWYYARAHSDAYGYLNKPSYVPNWAFLRARTYAENRLTGEFVDSGTRFGITQVSSSAGPVYSGPVFSHNLYAYSQVYGDPDFCQGYVSISDSMQGVKFPN